MPKALQELIAEAGGSPDWRERRMAMIALGYQREAEVLPALLEGLRDPINDVRHAAILALARRGDREAIGELLRPKILASPDVKVRWAATAALGKLGDHRIIDQLLTLVDDEEWLVSAEALAALKQKVADIVAARDLKLARQLLRMLSIPDAEIVTMAKTGLRDLGKDALPMLCEALSSVLEPVRRHAASVCGEIRDQSAAPALIGALQDPRPSVRAEAAVALGRIGATEAIKPLVAVLTDFDDQVRKSVVGALVALGTPAVEPLCITVEHTKSKIARCAGIEALGALGDPRAIPILVNNLCSSYHLVRRAAIAALTRFGRAAVEPLLALLSYNRSDISHLTREATAEGDVKARARAIRALGDLEDHRAAAVLKSLLSDGSHAVTLAAQTALEKIGCAAWGRTGAAYVLGQTGDRSVVPALVELLGDDSVNVRRFAVHALGGLKAVEHLERLSWHARHDLDPLVRRAALTEMQRLKPGAEEVFTTALHALTDASVDVRARATRVLGECADERSIQPLLARLPDPSWKVRVRAETALSSLGKAAVPGLIEVLQQGPMVARRRAASALGRIGDPSAVPALEARLKVEDDEPTLRLSREALLRLRC
jgi:HEAT repeat protein